MVEGRPLPSPPSEEEAFILLDYSNPNFFSKPKEEKIPENLEYAQEKKEYFCDENQKFIYFLKET